MHKILVTGSKGTLGIPLVAELKLRGHEVWQCDLQHHPDEKYFRADISSYRQLEHIFLQHQFDYVYNLAAEFGRWNGEHFYENLWMTNVVGLKHILQLQKRYKFRLIHFSSSEVYGDYPDVMKEDVMDKYEIRQLNDYAISKWVNELQIQNSEAMFGTETIRVRLFNTYGPGEYYSPYRSANCIFCYHALHDLPFVVYLGHRRTSTYVTDSCKTLANIIDNFKLGEVYNIGGTQLHDMQTVSNIILRILGKDDSHVTYKEAELFTTKDKIVDVSKAMNDLGHNPTIGLEEGLTGTLEWMNRVYSPTKLP